MNLTISKSNRIRFDVSDISKLQKSETVFESFKLSPMLEINIEVRVGGREEKSFISHFPNKIIFVIGRIDFDGMLSEENIKKGITVGDFVFQADMWKREIL